MPQKLIPGQVYSLGGGRPLAFWDGTRFQNVKPEHMDAMTGEESAHYIRHYRIVNGNVPNATPGPTTTTCVRIAVAKWEYDQVFLGSTDLATYLNIHGQLGWELVQIVEIFSSKYAIFKRPVYDAAPWVPASEHLAS